MSLLKFKPNYILIPLLVIITGSAASYFAEFGRQWHETINFPGWLIPGSYTDIVWMIIFILSSVSVLIIWNRYSRQKNFRLIIGLFILNAIINVGWNILFFSNQQPGLAVFQALLMVSAVATLVTLIWKCCPLAATCLLPYSVWVLFITILTINVWLIN